MTIEQSKEGRVLLLTVTGRIDSATSEAFREAAEQACAEDFDTLRLDLKEVDYISSKGLRVMLTLYKQLNGRRIEITGANIAVKEVFRMTGLEKEFHLQ